MMTSPISEWRDFYEMIGTASGVIVGATFVVASLASGRKESTLGMKGFITPTAVYLGSVLVSSAILTAPTLTLTWLALLLGIGGLAGMVYGIVVATRIWHMKLDLADRSFYVLLPIAAFGAMAGAALMARFTGGPALEILAISLVVLLVTGMRNAWDMANFMITRDQQG
jgi:hypothetical protein